MASLVIDRLTKNIQSTSETALIYFYCGSNASDRRSSTCLIRTLIHQLICKFPDLFELVDILYERNRISGFAYGALDLVDSRELLAQLLSNSKTTFIVIDALDECDATNRTEVLEALAQLLLLPNVMVKIFVSSRYKDDIALALENHKSLLIERQHNNDDISLFIQKEIEIAVSRKKLLRGKVDHELEQRVKRTLTQGANGM